MGEPDTSSTEAARSDTPSLPAGLSGARRGEGPGQRAEQEAAAVHAGMVGRRWSGVNVEDQTAGWSTAQTTARSSGFSNCDPRPAPLLCSSCLPRGLLTGASGVGPSGIWLDPSFYAPPESSGRTTTVSGCEPEIGPYGSHAPTCAVLICCLIRRHQIVGGQTMTRQVIASTEIRGGSGGATLAERISALVRVREPYAYCIPSLAGVLRSPEKLVRDSAQRVVVRHGLGVEQRVCHDCGRTDDALFVKALA